MTSKVISLAEHKENEDCQRSDQQSPLDECTYQDPLQNFTQQGQWYSLPNPIWFQLHCMHDARSRLFDYIGRRTLGFRNKKTKLCPVATDNLGPRERIGKNERWILVHCYLKTVKRELPPEWQLPPGYCADDVPTTEPCPLAEAGKWQLKVSDFWDWLFKSEVLLNYFGLEIADHKEPTRLDLLFKPHCDYFKGMGYMDW